MPIKNNRNSRDDKSKKVVRSAKSTRDSASKTNKKPERNDVFNIRPGKLFDSPAGEGFKKARKEPEGRFPKRISPDGKRTERATDSRPRKLFNSPAGEGFKKARTEPEGRFPKRVSPEGKRTERGADSRTGRKPEERGYKPRRDGDGDKRPSRSFDKPAREDFSRDRPRDKSTPSEYRKPASSGYGGRKTEDRRPKTEAGRGKYSEKRPFSKDETSERYRRSDTGKPFKKEYKGKSSGFSYDRPKRGSDDVIPTKSRRTNKPAEKSDGLIRLNRYISNAGICSRRKADELIEAGVVSVNGEVITALGTKVDPAKDVIRYNGEVLKREKMVYVLLNKPKDYITTTDDPQERRTVMELVDKASKERIYPVGRLDRNTTGLLLMTNDGELAEKLSHPRNNITKIYNVELNKNLSQGDMNKIAFGLELEDGLIKPDAVSYVQGGGKSEIGIQIHSGKNHIVRRIFEHLGYEVIKLDRVIYGNLTKKDLPRGRWRYLEEKEIIQLKHLMK